jgi:hypothetical protein
MSIKQIVHNAIKKYKATYIVDFELYVGSRLKRDIFCPITVPVATIEIDQDTCRVSIPTHTKLMIFAKLLAHDLRDVCTSDTRIILFVFKLDADVGSEH